MRFALFLRCGVPPSHRKSSTDRIRNTGRPRVFFDIQIGNEKTGRVALELVS